MLIKNADRFSFLDPAVYNEHQIFQIRYQYTWSQRKNFLNLIYLNEGSLKVHRLNKMFLSFQQIVLNSPIQENNFSRFHMPGTEPWERKDTVTADVTSVQPMPLSLLSRFCALALYVLPLLHKFFETSSMKRRNLFLYSLNLAWTWVLFSNQMWQSKCYTSSQSRPQETFWLLTVHFCCPVRKQETSKEETR